MNKIILIIVSILICFEFSYGQQNTTSDNSKIDESIFSGLKLRNIGPAKMSGRIADISVDPRNKSIRFVAAASGNVWKTVNSGTTWEPVFDHYGSYSIGVVEIDPNNSNIVWVGTGENNSQRSVSMGDGVYKSVDGGHTWKNMGLKTSEHIGRIVIDPRNSDLIYVASQGSVWKSGGERGLYKSVDGGTSWTRTLHVSENTGISDIIFDPRNPDVLLASSYQRRRHVGKLVAGGPDGGIWKSTDAGENWVKLKAGLPGGELGRIGMAVSPQKPNVTYALIAGTDQTKGFYRSENFGDNWKKMSDYMVNDAQYYMKLFPDPNQFDKVYSLHTVIDITEDGGKTFTKINNRRMHVDAHEIIFDKDDPNYIMIGNDGGIYESWDKTKTWRFTDNLPITQFYRVGIDDAHPFYNLYGGTQDNNTMGGPSRTINSIGIRNSDWFITTGGDGFQTRVEPGNPNIIYSESQYGGIVRFDKQSGEQLSIRPVESAGEPPLRWHWNAPILISPHNPTRIYFAAQKLFRSDDRGNSWKAVSEDLSRQIDRNKEKVMDRVWGIDAVFKNVWTSPYGTIVALDESPLQEGLIYVGTDDGLVQASTNGGTSWERKERFPGVADKSFVADLHASRHDVNVVFAVFNNHKFGDYKPYIMKSSDQGKSWTSIAGNLPEVGACWSIYQDHENENLLFLGSENGLYFTVDGGGQWIKFKSGIPTIAIRDLEIQKRENDLVTASFGRGFYILDDYSPLREINKELLDKEAHLFKVKSALQYVESRIESNSQGHGFFTSPNPDYGTVFTYYLKNNSQTLFQKRTAEEKKKIKASEPVLYPSWTGLVNEEREDKPIVVIRIYDEEGNTVNTVRSTSRKGINRAVWNLRHAGINGRRGALAIPGIYTASLALVSNGQWKDLGQSQSFEVIPLKNESLPAENLEEKLDFVRNVEGLVSSIRNANATFTQLTQELNNVKIKTMAMGQQELYESSLAIMNKIGDYNLLLNGNPIISKKMELAPASISRRASSILFALYGSRAAATETHKESYIVAEKQFMELATDFNQLIDSDIGILIDNLEKFKITNTLNPKKIN